MGQGRSEPKVRGARCYPGFSFDGPAGDNIVGQLPRALAAVRAVRGELCFPGGKDAGGLWPDGPDGRAGPGPGVTSPTVTGGIGGVTPCAERIRYRDQEAWVDCDFLAPYLADAAETWATDEEAAYGMCSSIADTLDLLWFQFRNEARGRHTAFAGLMGCYHLPIDSDPDPGSSGYWMFWSNRNGAPHKVHLYTCQPARDWGGDHPRWDACTLTINYRNDDPRFGSEPWHEGCRKDVAACDGGFNPDNPDRGTLRWGAWSPTWNDTDACWNGLDGGGGCAEPNSGAEMYGIGGEFHMTFHPVSLAFRGYTCDRISSAPGS